MTILLINFFSTLIIISGAMVIIVKNPLHSVLCLVASFLFSSIVLFLFENNTKNIILQFILLEDSHSL